MLRSPASPGLQSIRSGSRAVPPGLGRQFDAAGRGGARNGAETERAAESFAILERHDVIEDGVDRGADEIENS